MEKQHPADREAREALAQETTMSHRSRPWHMLTLALCASVIAILGLWLCLAPKQDFSEWENRTLAQTPTFSFSSLLDGTWTDQVADFCADQFPMRTLWVEGKARLELLCGRMENNGILAGQDGYLIPRQEYGNAEHDTLDTNLRAAASLSRALEEAGISFVAAAVPRSVDINREHLPPSYDPVQADAVWSWLSDAAEAEGLSLTDLLSPLRTAAAADETVWYRTDHHWTTRGAYEAYVALGQALGYTPYPLSTFSPETVSTNFYGTSFSSSGMYWLGADTLTLLRYPGDDRLQTIIGENNSQVLQGLYDKEALATQDQYRVFLGGTNGMIRVENPDDDSLPTLLLIKDSFAQSLAPFLARHYRLILVDPRAYRQSVYALACREKVDAVLLLYGIDTLATGNSLSILRMGLPTS